MRVLNSSPKPPTLLLFMTLWLPGAAAAQAQAPPAGMLNGHVTTPLDSPVVHATITLTSPNTSTPVTTTTNEAGDYFFTLLPPGSYDFVLEAEGYPRYTRHAIVVGTTSRMDVALEPAMDVSAGSLKQLEAGVAAKPDDYLAQFNLGRAYASADWPEKAIGPLARVLTLRPDFVPARLAVSRLALDMGDAQTALAQVQQALDKKPDSTPARILLAAAYRRLTRFEAARTLLNAILKDNPNEADAWLELGMLNLTERLVDKAAEPFRRAYALDPSNLRALRGLAEVQVQSDAPLKAVQVISDEVAREPQRRDLKKELGWVELRAKQYDQALATYQSLLDQYKDSPPEQGEILAHTAEAYVGKGDLPSAIGQLKKATGLLPDNVRLMSNLANVYERGGQQKEAIASYRSALKLDPGNALALNNLAYLIADSGGDLDEALRMVQQARRQRPEMNDILDTLGWVYLKKNLTDSAARVFEDLVERYSTNPTFHYHYGLALAQKGSRPEARKQFELALENHPSKEEEVAIKEMLSKLP